MPEYVILNKPFGVLSQFTADVPGQRTLQEFGLPPNVYAAGRLDANSEGLLLLTDDNQLIHRLLNPEGAHPRTYLAQLEGVPDERAMELLRRGVEIAGYITRQAEAKKIEDPELPPRDPPVRVRSSIPTSWIELTLVEGKNRQIRKMTAKVGYPTLRLFRSGIGPIKLTDLASGEWRRLMAAERDALRKAIGLH